MEAEPNAGPIGLTDEEKADNTVKKNVGNGKLAAADDAKKHLAGEKPVHGCRVQIAKKADRHSPRQAARRAREEETAREQDAAPDSGAHVARRRRIVTG